MGWELASGSCVGIFMDSVTFFQACVLKIEICVGILALGVFVKVLGCWFMRFESLIQM